MYEGLRNMVEGADLNYTMYTNEMFCSADNRFPEYSKTKKFVETASKKSAIQLAKNYYQTKAEGSSRTSIRINSEKRILAALAFGISISLTIAREPEFPPTFLSTTKRTPNVNEIG